MDTYETGGGAAVAQAATADRRQPRLPRGNRALGLVHPQPGPEHQPHCTPEVALADAVIALTSNLAIAKSERIEFNPEWFDIDERRNARRRYAAAGRGIGLRIVRWPRACVDFMASVQLKHVSKEFAGAAGGLRDVNFEVAEGELFWCWSAPASRPAKQRSCDSSPGWISRRAARSRSVGGGSTGFCPPTATWRWPFNRPRCIPI